MHTSLPWPPILFNPIAHDCIPNMAKVLIQKGLGSLIMTLEDEKKEKQEEPE
jgi:hypothetical protein